jgi:hypothetical protein
MACESDLIEGQNLRLEWRFANGNNDLLPGLAAELLGLGVHARQLSSIQEPEGRKIVQMRCESADTMRESRTA